jgi:hypothetical protein
MSDRNSLDAFVAGRGATLLTFFIGFLGTGAIALAILNLVNVPVLHADAERAEATVTKLEPVIIDLGGPRSRSFIDDVPVVRFQDGPRQVEVRVTNVVHPVGKFSVGEKVTVVYRAGRPEEARIPSFFEFYEATFVFGAVGVVFDLLALALFAAIRRKSRSSSAFGTRAQSALGRNRPATRNQVARSSHRLGIGPRVSLRRRGCGLWSA